MMNTRRIFRRSSPGTLVQLFFKCILGSGVCLSLTACQIYRNNGRNLFESAVPTPTSSVGSSTFPLLDQQKDADKDCWSQPKDEALWFAETNKQYLVHFIDDQSIEVCLEESHPASSASNP